MMNPGETPILVSACLLGKKCRYNGESCFFPELVRELKNRKIIPVCPETAAGLPIPRKPAEIRGGDGRAVWDGKAKVRLSSGEDVTGLFLAGAAKTWESVATAGVTEAVLKEKSPSCGKNYIYDGSFQKKLRTGSGVFTALIQDKGVTVYSETEWLTKER